MRGARAHGVAATLCLLAATASADTRPAGRRIEVHGHRGARALRPENTLAAFDYALAVGVDVLELDLGVTADDQLVVSHDQQIEPARCRWRDGRALKAPLVIRSTRLARLRRLDCGSLPYPRFPRQRRVAGAGIPTLEQVLELVERSRHPAARRVRLNIETKIVPGRPELSTSPERFAALVIGLLRRHRMLGRAMLQSFDHRTLAAARRLAPDLARVALVGESRPDLVAVARAAGAGTVSPNQRWITAADVRALHRAKLRVVPWTANDPADWKRLLSMGVDGIITDDPAGLIRFLERPH